MRTHPVPLSWTNCYQLSNLALRKLTLPASPFLSKGIQMLVSTGPTRNRKGKSTANPASGIRVDAFCTPSRPIPGAPLLGISTTETRMAATTGTGAAGPVHPRTAPSLWGFDAGSGSVRSPFLQQLGGMVPQNLQNPLRIQVFLVAMGNLGT